MGNQLKVSIGRHSDKGSKPINQDFDGAQIPTGAMLGMKGIAVVLADGISSSDVSQLASETAVKSFLDDYYCTSEAWSVRKSACQVLDAINSWLYATTHNSQYRYQRDKGYVCTLSALVLKSNAAHLFHAGDSRVYRLNASGLEQLTNDHRVWVTPQESHLSRALGIEPYCEFDYQTLRLETGDIFILATDGVYEFIDAETLRDTVIAQAADLDQAAQTLVARALAGGSDDNLTVQLLRVDALPESDNRGVLQQVEELPLPPMLGARMHFDGYAIVRELHATARSHVFVAIDEPSGQQVVVKTPSIDLSGDPAYLERLLTEEWIARRINSAHVLKAGLPDRKRNYLYTVFEHVEGQTLAQWIIDNPKPAMETVRGVVEQVAKGLRAFHRMDMLHQDIKPDNIMIDTTGTVKILDFGSVQVAGLNEGLSEESSNSILGTALYTAPEYFLGEAGTTLSEQFSLATITYYMLSGRFPYGTKIARCRTVASQRRLKYVPVLQEEQEIPTWVDETLRKALQIDPYKRYEAISEFTYDLRHPNRAYRRKTRAPLLERNPVVFWQIVSIFLTVTILVLLSTKL